MNKIFSNLILANVLSRKDAKGREGTITHLPPRPKPSPKINMGWVLMLFLAICIVMLASRYLTLNPDVFFPEQKLVYMTHITMLMMHVVGAMLALMIGPFQFLDGKRKGRFLKLHRWFGRTYLISVLFGGIGGLYMAGLSYGGMTTHLGFGALASLWLFSGFMAYKHIRNKNIESHRKWMTRNYALTFAGVTLRLWLPIFSVIGISFLTSYLIVSWSCWLPNLIVAEWITYRHRQDQQRFAA